MSHETICQDPGLPLPATLSLPLGFYLVVSLAFKVALDLLILIIWSPEFTKKPKTRKSCISKE